MHICVYSLDIQLHESFISLFCFEVFQIFLMSSLLQIYDMLYVSQIMQLRKSDYEMSSIYFQLLKAPFTYNYN